MKVVFRLLLFLLLAGLVRTGQAQVAARKILPNDILAIRVVGEPELTLDKRVGADGKITYPFILELSVEGKTVAEVEKEIRDLLDKDFLVQPQVTVEYRDYVKQWVTVVGQVNKPGRIELPADRRVDVIEAIAMAGDLTRSASKGGIELTRKGQKNKFTYDELKVNTDPEKRFFVEPDDVIEVKERIF